MADGSFSRRQFLGATGGLLAFAHLAARGDGDGRPKVTSPRSTSGDVASEPDWEQRLTVTVGPEKADLVGSSDRVLQAAVDYVSRLGGGTVHVQPGTYTLRNAIHLRSHVRILGSGTDSVLTKPASHKVKLAADSDWYDQEITLVDAKGFEVGDGVCLMTKDPHNGAQDVLKRTLVARSGNRFKLDRALRENFWLMGDSTCASLFPLLNLEEVQDVVVENITLDGNRANNENFNGNYAGCVFAQDCRDLVFRGVTARNYNGDGISWQICHDVLVENCHSQDNADLGLHPGSGSQRPLIRNNKLERNNIGIFFCWGIKYGLAEKNTLDGNRYGISIGHRDTNNLIRENTIKNSGHVGVLFRPERGKDFAPHRNIIENNVIENSGADAGIAIDIQGETEEVTIRSNDIRETREPMHRIGIRVGKDAKGITLADNQIAGFAKAIEELAKA